MHYIALSYISAIQFAIAKISYHMQNLVVIIKFSLGLEEKFPQIWWYEINKMGSFWMGAHYSKRNAWLERNIPNLPHKIQIHNLLMYPLSLHMDLKTKNNKNAYYLAKAMLASSYCATNIALGRCSWFCCAAYSV